MTWRFYRPIRERHENLLTNARATFGVMLTYSHTFGSLQAKSL